MSEARTSERLETGWWPDTPAGDTVLRTALLTFAASTRELARAAGGEVGQDGTVSRALAGSPCAYLNAVVPLAPPESWDALAVPPEGVAVTLWSMFPTPDLRTHRWHLVGHPPLMYRPPTSPPARDDPPGLDVTEVTDPAGLDAVSHTLVTGYPVEELREAPALFPHALAGAGTWRFWLGREAGLPVAAAAAYVTDEAVLVAWVATLPHHRGRGYGEALTWRAVRAAPGRPAVLVSSDDGRPVYARMGFVPLLRLTLWEHAAGRTPRPRGPA